MSLQAWADVAVVGGGPAGAVVAMRLAALGHSVVLLDQPRRPGGTRIAESLPASAWSLLDSLGLRPAVQRAGFMPISRSRLRWAGGDEELLERGEPSLLVDRSRLDALLLDAARAHGVQVLRGTRAGRAQAAAMAWNLPLAGPAGPGRLQAHWLVDASGGGSDLVPALPRTPRPALQTAALLSRWHGPAVAAESCVEAADHGWAWAAAHPGGGVCCAIFVDMQDCAGLGRAGREAFCRQWLARTRLLGGWLTHALAGSHVDSHAGSLTCDVSVRDATPWAHANPIAERVLRVGDAAARIDPLSSQGLQAAIHSALAAAAVVHTCLLHADRTELAATFYRRRQQELVQRHARQARRYYAQRSALSPTAFWQQRAGPITPAPLPAALLDTPAPRDGRALQLAPEASLVSLPVLEGELITEAEALDHPALERPLAFLGPHAIAPWLRALTGAGQDRAIEVRPPIDPRIAATHFAAQAPQDWCWSAIDWLWRRRLLVPAFTGETRP